MVVDMLGGLRSALTGNRRAPMLPLVERRTSQASPPTSPTAAYECGEGFSYGSQNLVGDDYPLEEGFRAPAMPSKPIRSVGEAAPAAWSDAGVEVRLGSTQLVISLDLDILGPQKLLQEVFGQLNSENEKLRVQCNGMQIQHKCPAGQKESQDRDMSPTIAKGSDVETRRSEINDPANSMAQRTLASSVCLPPDPPEDLPGIVGDPVEAPREQGRKQQANRGVIFEGQSEELEESRVVALYDFDPTNIDWPFDEAALPMAVGELIEVLEHSIDDSQWALGFSVGKPGFVGYFPKNYTVGIREYRETQRRANHDKDCKVLRRPVSRASSQRSKLTPIAQEVEDSSLTLSVRPSPGRPTTLESTGLSGRSSSSSALVSSSLGTQAAGLGSQRVVQTPPTAQIELGLFGDPPGSSQAVPTCKVTDHLSATCDRHNSQLLPLSTSIPEASSKTFSADCLHGTALPACLLAADDPHLLSPPVFRPPLPPPPFPHHPHAVEQLAVAKVDLPLAHAAK